MNHRHLAIIISVLSSFSLCSSVSAQTNDKPNVLSSLKSLQWRAIGPAIMGGRIDEFAVVESRPGTMYVATASGGVLKSLNFGTTWTSVFDSQPNLSIGAINVDPVNPDTVWVGTGEANNRQSSSWGEGVFKSTDGGRTWKNVGLEKTMAINRIQIDPNHPDTIYVAALGNLWGPNPDRGVFKTTDGGSTWTKCLFIDENTGITDISVNPQDPNDILAAAYQRRRTAFGFNGGGPQSGLYHSSDGGAHWAKVINGLPVGDKGRIGLGRSRKTPKVIYAIIEAEDGGVFRSDDNGLSFKKMNSLNPRPMYYSNIHVDPTDDTKLWVLGVNLHYSTDSGKNFITRPINKIHSDFHAFWIDPKNPKHFMAGCDGGIWWTNDNGLTWDYNNNFPLGQFYEVAYDFKKPYNVFGGLQDNFSWTGPSSSLGSEGPSNDEWQNIGGGDGFYCAVDPINNEIVYQESQNGGITRLNMFTGERKGIKPRSPAGEPAYRFDWNSPIVISPHNPKRIYIGGNRLFISDDRGDNWRRTIDLSTQPDRSKWPILGVTVTAKTLSSNDGQDSFGQILTMSESPVKRGLLYVGTDDGNVQVSTDDGSNWTNLSANISGVAPGTYVSRVVASKYVEGRVYVTFDGHRSNDFSPHIFVSEDFGKTWKSIVNGIPLGSTLHVVREHHRNPNLLFAGTEKGLYISFNRGEHWEHVTGSLPNVPVDDVQIHPRDNDIILATHGRSIWVLDDIAAIEGIADAVAADKPTIFPIRNAVSYRVNSHKGFTGDKKFYAPNAPNGAIIQYFLPRPLAENETCKLVILDKSGRNSIAEIRNASKNVGINRVIWDMRLGAAAATPTEAPIQGRRRAIGIRGPRVLPGTYTAQLSVGKDVVTATFTAEEDPRLKLTEKELKARFDLLVKLNSLSTTATDIRRVIDKSVDDLDELLKSDAFKPADKGLQEEVTNLHKSVVALQDRFNGKAPKADASKVEAAPAVSYQQKITQTIFSFDAITEAPSKEAITNADNISKDIRALSKDVNNIAVSGISELNKKLEAAKFKPLALSNKVALRPFDGTQVQSATVLVTSDEDDDQ